MAGLRYLRLVPVQLRIAVLPRLACALVLASSVLLVEPAHAAPPPDAGAAPVQQNEAELAEVRQLYEDGKAKFDTYDYDGAIDLWTKAYGKLDPVEGNREIRNNLVYNIATAQEKAYDLDGQVAHLRQARALLQRYLDEYKALYRPTPEGREEVAKVEARIQELDDRIAGAGQDAPPAAEPPEARPDPERELAKLRDQKTKDLLRNDPDLSARYKSGRGMIIGGSVALGVGGTLALAAASTWNSTENVGGRATLITVGSVGGALLVTGAVLVGLGVPKRKNATRDAREKAATMITQAPEAHVVVAPTLSAQTFGLQVGGRF